MTLPTPEECAAIKAVETLLEALNTARGPQDTPTDLMVRTDPFGTVEIAGNTDGLLWLARYVLRVARAESVGYHEHIDAAGFALEGSTPMVVMRLEADAAT